jgi:glycosyltransferase involved in cell wall biosynthesis
VRLLFVVPQYGADVPGAGGPPARDLVTRLARRDHQVEVLTAGTPLVEGRDHSGPVTTTEDGVVVHRLAARSPRDDRFIVPLHRRVLDAPGPVAHVVERAWLRMHGPDLPDLPSRLRAQVDDVDLVVFFACLAATSLDGLHAVTGVVPTVFHPLAADVPELRLGVLDEMFHAADTFACTTEEEQQLVVARFRPRGTSAVVGTGIAVDGGDPDVAGFRARFDLGDRPYLLTGGALASDDGAVELTEMFAARAALRGDDVALVVLGEHAPGRARSSGVVGTGPVDDATRAAAIAGCRALVRPSYTDLLPTALLDAWAVGRPALVQGRCAPLAGEARRSGAALAYAGFAEFEAAVDLLVAEPETATALGASGRRYVETRYRWDDVLTRYEWFLEDAIAHWRPPSGARRLSIG